MRSWIPFVAATGLVLLISGLATESTGRRQVKATVRIPFGRLLVSLGIFLVTGFLIAGLTGLPVLAALAAFGGGGAPFLVRSARGNRRARASRAQWPDVIQDLISIIRSGASLPEAWARLGEREFPGISEHLAASNSVYRASGSFVMGLEEARRRLRDPVADHVLMALTVAYEVGGTDLVPALRSLAESVAADLTTRQEIEARWSWTVSSARVAAAAPWLVLLLMLSRPETVRAYSSSGGAAVLMFAALATVTGYLLMLRAARLPEQRGWR